MGEVPAFGIGPFWLKEIGPDGKFWTKPYLIKGAGGHDFWGYVFVDDLVDETGVRPVFQQAADQISQQVFVCAHGSIDPTPCVL